MSQLRVLIVGTSNDRMVGSEKRIGAWAEEIAVPYYFFKSKGYVVEFASPRGGHMPLDPRSTTVEVQRRCTDVRRFLADSEAMTALDTSISIVYVRHSPYDAIYVAGGHGIVWDGSVNNELATLLGKALEHGRCVATCGHGAAALLDVKDPFNKDQSFVKNKEVTAPTRDDEAAAGLLEHVPWLLQDELKKRGAIFSHADTIDAPWAVRSGNLVTGQNFNAARRVAELVIEEQSFGVRVTP